MPVECQGRPGTLGRVGLWIEEEIKTMWNAGKQGGT